MEKSFKINFTFILERSSLIVPLQAIVIPNPPQANYLVGNISVSGQKGNVLPSFCVKRIADGDAALWVHLDTLKSTELSEVVGKAIEKKLMENERTPH